jgi:amino acid transporter
VASSEGVVEHTTSAALEEKAKLQRHFGRFDMFFFLICTLVGLDTIGAVASNGAQGFTWLMFLGLVFFIPYAFLTAELGAAFTEEGGLGNVTQRLLQIAPCPVLAVPPEQP